MDSSHYDSLTSYRLVVQVNADKRGGNFEFEKVMHGRIFYPVLLRLRAEVPTVVYVPKTV